MAQEWDIKPRDESCRECNQPFADQQPCFSSLVFSDEGYQRADYCETCWAEKTKSLSSYSAWRGIFRLPPPEPEEVLKKETAESLLRRMMEDADEVKINVIYILAVMLERKRVLVERDVQFPGDGTMVRIYEHRKTGETFLVPDPRLQLDELEEVQEQVVAMLGGQGSVISCQSSVISDQESEAG